MIGKKVNAREIFMALSVLRPQQWAPVLMLKHLWGLVDERRAKCIARKLSEFSLVALDIRKITCGNVATVGVRVHDLVLEYCREQAEGCEEQKNFHAKVLNGYAAAFEGN